MGAWADTHPEQVKQAASRSDLDRIHTHALTELGNIKDQMIRDSEQFLSYLFNSKDEPASGFQGHVERRS